MANDKEKELSKRIMLDLNSAKNEDVYSKIASRDKNKYPKHIDYICDAIRAFNEFKTGTQLDVKEIEDIVDNLLQEKLKTMVIKSDIVEPIVQEEVKKSLEDDINENINTDDD